MIWSGVGSFTMMNFNIIKIKMTHSRSCSIIVCGREGGSDRRSRIIWLQEIVNPAALHIWQIWSTTRLVAHLTPLCWKHEEAKHRAKKKSLSSILLLPPAGHGVPAEVWGFWMGASICSKLRGNRPILLIELVAALWRLPSSCDTRCGYGLFFLLLLCKSSCLWVEPRGVKKCFGFLCSFTDKLGETTEDVPSQNRQQEGRAAQSPLAIMRQSPWLQEPSLWYVEAAINKICKGPLLNMTFVYLPRAEREAVISGFSEVAFEPPFQGSFVPLPQKTYVIFEQLNQLISGRSWDAGSQWQFGVLRGQSMLCQ